MSIKYVACALLSLSPGAIAADGREQAATEAASAWLTLLDQAKYADAWEGLAEDRQGIPTLEAFERIYGAYGKRIGKAASRRVTFAADDGRHVVIEFAVLTKSMPTRETVTVMQETDGRWKVTKHALHQSSSSVVTRR